MFLLAFTSMKLNFIANMVKLPYFHVRKNSAPEYLTHPISIPEDYSKSQISYISTIQEEIKNWQLGFNHSQEIKTIILDKKIESFFRFLSRFDNVFATGKLKIRRNLDCLGRMATCGYEKNRKRRSVRKTNCIAIPEIRFRTSLLTTQPTERSVFETFTDETDFSGKTGESEEEIIEVSIPELKQSLQFECERIKVTHSVYGFIEISQNYLVFVSDGKEKPTGGIYFGSSLKFMQETKKCSVVCEVSEITEVFPRRYIHKHTAFEVYLKSGCSYFFNVFTPEYRENILEAMKS